MFYKDAGSTKHKTQIRISSQLVSVGSHIFKPPPLHVLFYGLGMLRCIRLKYATGKRSCYPLMRSVKVSRSERFNL